MAKLVPASEWHIPFIAGDVRQIDELEARAVSGRSVIAALNDALTMSSRTTTVLSDEGIPVAMYGVVTTSFMGRVGAPWLLGTNGFPRLRKQIASIGPIQLEEIAKGYKTLTNFVHSRNEISKRWLKSLGFAFGSTVMFSGEPFIEFRKDYPDV